MTDVPGITSGETTVGTEWTCPFCGRAQALTTPKTAVSNSFLGITDPADGKLALKIVALGCANTACRRTTIAAALHHYSVIQGLSRLQGAALTTFRLQPRGREVPLPEYIPEAIRKDYREASLIIDLSPNAAAALSRRCLQGILMDYAGVKKDLLGAQIRALKGMLDDRKAAEGVTSRNLDAIEHVRDFGNIGAHMEQPTGVVIDVEPQEAVLLLELVETLFRDWYVERHEREERYQRLAELSAGKRQLREDAKRARSKAAEPVEASEEGDSQTPKAIIE